MSIRNKAIFSIHSNVVCIIGKSDARDKDENSVVLDEDKIKIETDRLQAEYDAQEYARNRKAEYPTIEELVVALYDTEDKVAVDEKRAAVKLKYPKS
tara:strand:- start:3 stop:293 length:291 start_codon:yes stop_codon:yes gene_type:complete